MTHLRIELNNIQENVNNIVIEKLYEIASSGDLDASSNLSGLLHTPFVYKAHVLYLTTMFPLLTIAADDYAIPFEDPNMITYLNSIGVGSGGYVTESQATTATMVANSANTTVTKFNELRYFTNITLSKGGFTGSSSGDVSFYNWTTLEEIDISNFVSLGHNSLSSYEDTFYNCTSLKKVIASNKLTALGYSAFRNCSNLLEITGLSGEIIVSQYAFLNCSKITDTSFSNVLFAITGFNGVKSGAFQECAALTEITLSPNTNDIPKETFKNCTNLTTVNNLANTVSLHYDAFCGCSSITNNTFNNVEFIFEDSSSNSGGYFYNCLSITEITLSPLNVAIPRNTFKYSTISTVNNTLYVRRIYPAAFNSSPELIALDLSNLDTTNSNVISAFGQDGDANSLFYGCSKLTTLGKTIFPNITHLGSRCFMDCNELSGSLNFPDQTGDIGPVFSNCKKLEYVFLGHPTTLYHGNYNNGWDGLCPKCEKLKTAYLGDSVTGFSPYNFYLDNDLLAVIINNPTPPDFKAYGTNDLGYSNGNYSEFTREKMLGNNNCFLYVPDSAVNTYKATFPWSQYPEAVKSFKEYPDYFEFYNETFTNAKYQGYGFGSLNIVNTSGNGIIEANTFKNCTNLTDITLDGISEIKGSAFEGCSLLESIDLSGVTLTGDNIFNGCTALESIGVTRLLDIVQYDYVPASTFLDCSSLQGPFDFTGIKGIRGSAFFRSGLSGVLNLPDIVEIYHGNVFSNTNITKAIIGDSITNIGGSCFDNCTSLTEVDIDFSNIPVANLGNMGSFVKGCTSLQTFDCTGLKKLANNFFNNCTNLTTVTGLDSITTIGDQAFKNCTALTSITIPSTCTTISQLVFAGCSNLTTINGLTSITYIGKQAFDGCSNWDVTDLNLSNVTTIQASSYLFRNCSNLKGTLNLSGLSNNSAAGDFMGCSKLQKIIFGSIDLIYSSRIGYGYCQFGNCNLLEVIDVSQVNKITFSSCAIINNNVFKALIIRNTSQIPTLTIDNNSIPAITWDKFAPNAPNAKIYVDDSLYSTYINDPDWSILASHIDVISNYVAS